MKNYKKILILLIVISIILILEYIATFPIKFGLCVFNDTECSMYHLFSWGGDLHFFPIFPFLIFIVLFFTPASFFRAWRWFALIFGLISIALVAHAPEYGGMMSINKKYIYWLTSISFFIISLLIILFQTYKHFRNKKKSEEKTKQS